MIVFFLRFYIELHMFQLSNYDYIKYFETYKRRLFYDEIPYIIFGILSFFMDTLTYSIAYLIIIMYFLFRYKKAKKKLVFTSRIKRLCILSVLLMGMLYFVCYKLILFAPIIMLLASIILYPIERMIHKYYLSLAKEKLDKYSGIKIGITGSYGKTSTKYYLDELLETKYLVLKTPKSYNTPLGIAKIINENPIFLYDVLIIEMGASKKNDIEELMKLVNPNITILTSIGEQHLKTFKSVTNIINEKSKIVNLCLGTSFVNANNKYIKEIKFNKEPIYVGSKGNIKVKSINDNCFDIFYYNDYLGKISTKLKGNFQNENIALAIAVAFYLKVDFNLIQKKCLTLCNIENRLNVIKSDKITFLSDSYNSNIIGAKAAIKELSKYNKKKYIVTPGFVEMGSLEKEHHKNLAYEIISYNIIPILIGDKKTRDLQIVFKNNLYQYYIFNSFNKAIKWLKDENEGEEIAVLIENDLPDNY